MLQSGAGAEGAGFLFGVGPRRQIYPTRKMYDVAAAVAASEPWLQRIMPRLEALRDQTQETAILGKEQGGQVIYLAVLEGPQNIRYTARPGDLKPLHSSSIGKTLLATMKPRVRADVLAKLPLDAMTNATITNRARLVEEIEGMRGARLFDHPRRKRRRRHGGRDAGEVRRRHLRRRGGRPDAPHDRAGRRTSAPPGRNLQTDSGGAVSELVATDFEDGVLHVTLSRPEKRNALSNALIAAIGATFSKWSERDDVSVAVLTGAGDKAFASGGDLKELESLREEADAVAFAARTRAALDTIRRFPVPVVAVVNGDALGGGAELAMACDLRVAMAHARIGFLQAKLNIATAWGGGTDLFNIVGPSRALRLLATARSARCCGRAAAGAGRRRGSRGGGGDRLRQVLCDADDAAAAGDARDQVARDHASLRRLGGRAGGARRRRFAKAWVHDDHWAAVAKMAGPRK